MRAASETLKARGITRLVYFHSDHFEPWRHVPGRAEDFALSADDVAAYVERTAPFEFARRATLFYKANVNYAVEPGRPLWRADPRDAIGLVPPRKVYREINDRILAALAAGGRELQVHIHHENITWNDQVHDRAMREHLATPEHRQFDAARLELLVRLNLDLLANYPGFDPARWFFVHGHWALNASDPHECTIVREIEILRRNGCLGDFTQPSGRPHTDSRSAEPYLVRPVPLAKGFDRPEAEPVAAAGAGAVAADRFLIWASEIKHRYTSIDHYSGFVRDRMADPDVFARANAELSFAHDGVLYVKTHAHTMQPIYWQADGCGPFPHAHPAIQAELGRLFDAADAAGCAIEFATISEVFDRLMAAPAPAERDLVALYGLAEGDPMTEVGCDVVFRDEAGEARVAPALAPDPVGVPALAATDPGTANPDPVWATVEDRLPAAVAAEAPPPIPLTTDPALVAIADALAPVVARVLAARGEQPAWPLDQPGALAAEMHLVRTLEGAGLDPEAPVVAIGCGTGLLAVLLAARGWTVTGIDRRAGPIETARAIAAAAAEAGLLVKLPRFEVATFPDWNPGTLATTQAIAVVPHLSNAAGLSGQAAFIRGLASFDTALIDLRRFFVERVSGTDQQRLVALFGQAGFDAPRLVEGEGRARLAIFHHGRPRGLAGWAGRMLRGLGLGRAA